MRYAAWTFDPGVFHAWLSSRVLVDDTFSAELMRETAMEVASRADSIVVDYLDCFALHGQDAESWADAFDVAPEEYTAEFYAYCMAGHLTPAPALSTATYGRLQWLLPMAGIGLGARRTATLLEGRPLRWLVEDDADAQLQEPVGRQLRARADLGGWLPADIGDGVRVFLDRVPCGLVGEHHDQLREGLRELSLMLEAAADRGHALRLVVTS